MTLVNIWNCAINNRITRYRRLSNTAANPRLQVQIHRKERCRVSIQEFAVSKLQTNVSNSGLSSPITPVEVQSKGGVLSRNNGPEYKAWITLLLGVNVKTLKRIRWKGHSVGGEWRSAPASDVVPSTGPVGEGGGGDGFSRTLGEYWDPAPAPDAVSSSTELLRGVVRGGRFS